MVVVPEGGLGPTPLPSLLFSVDAAISWFLSLTHSWMLRAEPWAERTDGGRGGAAPDINPRTVTAALRGLWPRHGLGRSLDSEQRLFNSNQFRTRRSFFLSHTLNPPPRLFLVLVLIDFLLKLSFILFMLVGFCFPLETEVNFILVFANWKKAKRLSLSSPWLSFCSTPTLDQKA